MSRICNVQGLLCLGFIMCRVCHVYGLLCLGSVMSRVCYVQGLLCLVFVCLGFVMFSVCLSRVGHGTDSENVVPKYDNYDKYFQMQSFPISCFVIFNAQSIHLQTFSKICPSQEHFLQYEYLVKKDELFLFLYAIVFY